MKKISTVLVVISDKMVLREVVTLLDNRGVETIIAESFPGMVFGLDKYQVDAIVMWPYVDFSLENTVNFLRRLPERGFEGPVVVVDARPEDREALFRYGVKYEISGDTAHNLIAIFGIKTDNGEVRDESENGFVD